MILLRVFYVRASGQGETRRLRRGGRACSPMRCSIVSCGDPKGTGGNGGKRVSSGYNRRRRLAPRSSGKQQAERTAVRAAPIVCPEESPQCARRRKPLPRWGLARRLRRELGLAVPWGAHTFLSVAKEKCAKESQRHGDSGKKPFIAHF